MTNQKVPLIADYAPDDALGKRHRGKVRKTEVAELQEEMRRLRQAALNRLVINNLRQPRRTLTIHEEQPIEAAEMVEEVDYSQAHHIRDTETTEREETTPLTLWWIPAFIFYGFGDVLTSALCYAVGATETNPIARALLELPAGIVIFALVKTVILLFLVFVSYYYMRKYGWIIPCILTIIGVFLVANNIIVFLSAV